MEKTLPTIMIVDDELYFRTLLRDILEAEGFPIVAEATDGNDAVEKYRQFHPQVTIMDIFMPGKHGIDATKEIIAFDGQAKILICSGVGFDDDVVAARAAGAGAVILKPFIPAEVKEAINSVLGSAQ
jgi:two-component system chemotaxis response regulator CheY